MPACNNVVTEARTSSWSLLLSKGIARIELVAREPLLPELDEQRKRVAISCMAAGGMHREIDESRGDGFSVEISMRYGMRDRCVVSGALVALKWTEGNLTSTQALRASVGLMNGCSLMGRFPHCGSTRRGAARRSSLGAVGLRAETPCCLCFLWDEFDARIVRGTPVHDPPISVFPLSDRGHLGVVCGKHPPSGLSHCSRLCSLPSRRLEKRGCSFRPNHLYHGFT